MKKVSVPATNDLCPQTLFVFGSMNQDGTPDFGLFCWFSYCWHGRQETGSQLGVICAIGANKRTLENIRRQRVFSANLVVEENLALADYFGTADGRDTSKMTVPVAWEKGAVLPVPILCSSPLSFELEVEQEISVGDEGETVLLCYIRNTLKDEQLVNTALTPQQIFEKTAAVSTAVAIDDGQGYWSWDGRYLGQWNQRAKEIRPDGTAGAAAGDPE